MKIIAAGAPLTSTVRTVVSLSGQTSTIGTTTLYTPPAAGTYRISYFIACTVAGSAGTLTPTVGYNNGVITFAEGNGAINLTTTSNRSNGTFLCHSAANQPLTYSMTVAGATGSPQFAVDVVVEQIQ